MSAVWKWRCIEYLHLYLKEVCLFVCRVVPSSVLVRDSQLAVGDNFRVVIPSRSHVGLHLVTVLCLVIPATRTEFLSAPGQWPCMVYIHMCMLAADFGFSNQQVRAWSFSSSFSLPDTFRHPEDIDV
jgi:hypothetical protein